MNWYKFKVELLAWAATTILATLTAVILLSVLFWPVGAMHMYPVYLGVMAHHGNAGMHLFFAASVFTMWLCRWKALRILRKDPQYTK